MHLIWSSEVKCIVTVWFLWSFWYILSNGVGDVTSRWRHFWFTSQHQSNLKYLTHNSGSHYYCYYRSHQHTRTWNENIYIAIKDYPEIRVWSYLPQAAHSFWERPIYIECELQITFCSILSDLWGNGKLHTPAEVWSTLRDVQTVICRQRIYFSCIQTDVSCTKVQLRQTVIQVR